jgi:hypothetical protein
MQEAATCLPSSAFGSGSFWLSLGYKATLVACQIWLANLDYDGLKKKSAH